MRKIKPLEILIFSSLMTIILALGFASAYFVGQISPFKDLIGVTYLVSFIFATYMFSIIVFRIFLLAFPLNEGEISKGERQEFTFNIYVLFYLLFFNSLIRTSFIPVPVMRLVYIILGAKLGSNTFSSGVIFDPSFVQAGENCLFGERSLVIPHVIENDRLGMYSVIVGNNVTLGAYSVVLGGVTIGDGALVATGAIVKKGTVIGPGEVWGGVPAKRLSGKKKKNAIKEKRLYNEKVNFNLNSTILTNKPTSVDKDKQN